LLKEWLTNRGKQADKAFKRWNDKLATKLVIETTSSKLLGLDVDQTAKPNQTSLALCLQFLSPWNYQEVFTKGRFYTENF